MKLPPVIVVQMVHILGPFKGEIQEFSKGAISIGRHPSCDLCFPVDLTSISRKHADIIREGNKFKLIDHSGNGTFVNGKPINEAFLKNGDVLSFAEGGPKVSFLTQLKEGMEEPQIVLNQKPCLQEVKSEKPEFDRPEPSHPVYEEPEQIVQRVKVPLIIQYGPTLRSFKELPVTIGKNPKCDFRLDHPAIFDQQAQIFFRQNQYVVKDLTGQRSVQINRQPVVSQAPLNVDDELSLSPKGPVFRFLGEGRLIEVSE